MDGEQLTVYGVWTVDQRREFKGILEETSGDRAAVLSAMRGYRPAANEKTVSMFICTWAPKYRLKRRYKKPFRSRKAPMQGELPLVSPKKIVGFVSISVGTTTFSATKETARAVVELLVGL